MRFENPVLLLEYNERGGLEKLFDDFKNKTR